MASLDPSASSDVGLRPSRSLGLDARAGCCWSGGVRGISAFTGRTARAGSAPCGCSRRIDDFGGRRCRHRQDPAGRGVRGRVRRRWLAGGVGVVSAVSGAAAAVAGGGRVAAAASRRGGRPAGGLLAGLSPVRSRRHRQVGAGADVGVDGDSCRGGAEAASVRCRAAVLEGGPPAATVVDHHRGPALVRRHDPRLLDLPVGATRHRIGAGRLDVPARGHLGRRAAQRCGRQHWSRPAGGNRFTCLRSRRARSRRWRRRWRRTR